ncbi:MAG: hypothetical protein K2G84_07725, partial [Muribaculaceae bacterium]|nr:hypothetical protein [Muribaculaceae bacterium]
MEQKTTPLPDHGIFTYADKDSLGYASAEELRESILGDSGARIEALERTLDTLLEADDSSAIDNFREILGFLEGLTDDEKLAARLADIGRRLDEAQGVATRSLGGVGVSADGDTVELTTTLNDGSGETVPFPMSSQTSAGAVTAAQARAIANAPELAFRELWKSAGCSVKEDADPSEMYVCNGLGMSYAEARAVYAAGVMTNDNRTTLYANCNIRTHLPHRIHAGVTTCPHTFRYSRVEVVNASLLIPGDACFLGCSRLRKVTLYSPMAAGASYANAYQGCSALETLVVYGSVYARSFSLADSPLISLASLQGIIAKTQPGMAAFAITLH